MNQLALKIGGITPLTSIDYPGELAAVIFCQGCPWRCRYCQNSHLLPRTQATTVIEWIEVMNFLHKRRGLLDAVVFSGGEPTLQRDLPQAIRQIKQLGFKAGLHTAGCYPDRLKELLPLVDWVGLDIKGLPDQYPEITQTSGSGEHAWESLRLVQASGVDYEVRTTLMPGVSNTQILALAETLGEMGVRHYSLQTCQTHDTYDPALKNCHGSLPDQQMVEKLQQQFADFIIRS